MVIPGYPQTLRSLPKHVTQFTTTMVCSCCGTIETNVWSTQGVILHSTAGSDVILSPDTDINKFIKYNQELLSDPELTPLCLLN